MSFSGALRRVTAPDREKPQFALFDLQMLHVCCTGPKVIVSERIGGQELIATPSLAERRVGRRASAVCESLLFRSGARTVPSLRTAHEAAALEARCAGMAEWLLAMPETADFLAPAATRVLPTRRSRVRIQDRNRCLTRSNSLCVLSARKAGNHRARTVSVRRADEFAEEHQWVGTQSGACGQCEAGGEVAPGARHRVSIAAAATAIRRLPRYCRP